MSNTICAFRNWWSGQGAWEGSCSHIGFPRPLPVVSWLLQTWPEGRQITRPQDSPTQTEPSAFRAGYAVLQRFSQPIAIFTRGFPGGSDGKESSCQCRRSGMDPWVRKILLEKEMATHSSTPAWKIPWTEESGGLQFTGSQGAGHDWSDLACGMFSSRLTQSCWWLFSICYFSPNSAMAPLKSVHLLDVPGWQEEKLHAMPHILLFFSVLSVFTSCILMFSY